MNRDQLLAEVEKLSHSARLRRMVELGRASGQDESVQQGINTLFESDVYECGLALMTCYGSRDSQRVLRALNHPSRTIRGLALSLTSVICSDAEVEQAFTNLSPARLRRVLLKKLAKRRRQAAVDARLQRLLDRGDVELDGLLSFGSIEFVRRALGPAMASGLQGIHDPRLARWHPQAVADLLIGQAREASQHDARLLAWARVCLPELADKAPQRALEIVLTLGRHAALCDLPLQRLVERLPAQAIDLLARSAGAVTLQLMHVAPRLDVADLERLIATRGELLPLSEHWFRRRAPNDRLRLYERFHRGWRDAEGCLPAWLIRRLPGEQRWHEARAHWNHPPLAARPLQRFGYAGSLPVEEARRCLEPYIRNPDAEVRAAANAALLSTLRFEREGAAELLSFVVARKNEQDPVRLALLGSLAALPVKIWQTAHLEALGLIVRQALDATDLSYATAAQIGQFVAKLLPVHPAWAIPWLATLVKERGQLFVGPIEDRLTDDDVRQMMPALLPVLRSWEVRERQQHLIHAAASLGMRLKVAPELVTILSGLALNATSVIASMALGVLAQHVPATLPGLIPRLLESDPSWITQPIVYSHLHLRRQDLLTPFLGRQAYRGKFSTGKTRFVLPLSRGFQRWTALQQATFAKTLDEIIHDAERDSPALLQAIHQIAALPAVTPASLFELAAISNTKLVTRDAALRALSRLDAGQGVQTLLEAMEDDRARVAIYVLRPTMLQLPSGRALDLLKTMKADKVTVAKEVVRLLGELKTPAAYAELVAWSGRELHRDVHVALLRSLWDYLDEDATWPILEQAASALDPVLATSVGRISVQRASMNVQSRLVDLIAKLLGHPDPKVRCDTLLRCETLPLADPEQRLQPVLLAALESPLPDEVAAAAAAVFTTYTGRQASAVGDAARRLAGRFRELATFCQVLLDKLVNHRQQLRPTVVEVLRGLADAPLTITLRVRLAARGLEGVELSDFLKEHVQQLHADALAAAISEIACLPREVSHWHALSEALSTNADERLRRIALAALVAAGNQSLGWCDEYRAKLQTYQHDDSVLVAGAAAFTFPPEFPCLEPGLATS